ncbi:MAG: Hpt domain-containing protein [Desulfobulbaceae bacterium]|nr:Hpt domain-containing protein [Desulfobulbaceae bacterium]HIJ79711.1 Hpt domain-containing protein [Deltaproteobacteria bacterium]
MVDLGWDRSFALEQSGDDEEILEELLDLFRDSSASDLAKIKNGVADRDSVAVADAAHSIKGAAASLGIEGIRRVATDMEKNGREGDLEKIPDLLVKLEALLVEVAGIK